MARPTKYNATYHVPWARSLMLRGCTIQELADQMEVTKSTIHKWMNEHEEFSDAIKRGRDYSDLQVELSLYKRATGTKVTEKKTIVQTGKNGETIPARVEVYEKDVPPDTTACIFWLKNRRPAEWRETNNISLQTDSNIESVKDEIKNIILGKDNND